MADSLMRSRQIRPKFFISEQVAGVSCHARLLFIGLWCVADREGRFKWKPKELKRQILPDDKVDCAELLEQLAGQKLIRKYEVNGEYYGVILKFKDHQKVNPNEAQSTIPDPSCSEMINHDQPKVITPDATPSGVKEKEKIEVLDPREIVREKIPEALPAFDEWIAYKKKRRETLLPESLLKLANKVCTWGAERTIAAVDSSIEKGYAGLFEPGAMRSPAPRKTHAELALDELTQTHLNLRGGK